MIVRPPGEPLFRQALATARTSLDATPSKLEMLRRANVVDAGALGFVELAAGMADYFETGIVPGDDAAIQLLRDDEITAGSQMDLEHRYCTECMITGEAIDRRKLREEASADTDGPLRTHQESTVLLSSAAVRR